MKSDHGIYHLFKYTPVLVGAAIVGAVLNALFTAGQTVSTVRDVVLLVVGGVIGVGVMCIPLTYRNSLVLAELTEQTIIISRGAEVITVPWGNVRHISRVGWVRPALYTLKIYDRPGYFLFNTGYTSMFFSKPAPKDIRERSAYDQSDMGRFIRRKKEALSI